MQRFSRKFTRRRSVIVQDPTRGDPSSWRIAEVQPNSAYGGDDGSAHGTSGQRDYEHGSTLSGDAGRKRSTRI